MIHSAPFASTQSHLDIEDIRDNLVILKDGSCCLILQSNAVNFSLLSEGEQDATIYSYAALLNSLTYSIQIIIKSQKKDINSYLSLLNAQKQTIKNPLLKGQLEKYYQFIQKIVQENEVLDKRFYLIIPFSSLELGISSALGSAFKKKSSGLPFSVDYIVQKAKNSLFPKRDHLISQLTRLGLRARQLTTPELIKFFYLAYNPDSGSVDFPDNAGYTAPLVTAAINPIPPEPTRKENNNEAKNTTQT
ncbi:MAG: hypothetical protein U0946_04235 [Patescibacteria group bacterium]|nr:hypothetical protein [Patescibacteria group bacterium]